MDQETLKASKQHNIVSILFLRKILRQNYQNKIYNFQKLGLGNIKYEVCPNFAYSYLKVYKTFLYSSSKMYEYDIQQKKIILSNKTIEALGSNYSRVTQINENDLLISGGQSSNRLTFYNLQKCEESKLNDERGMHGIAFNKAQIYFISGIYKGSCEMLNLKEREKLVPIQEILEKQDNLRGFGANIKFPYVYAFGGYQNSVGSTNKIRRFQIQNNKWEDINEILPAICTTMSVDLQKKQLILIYDNWTSKLETQIFDISVEQCCKHGSYFETNGCCLITNPLQREDFVYQFNHICDLYVYEIKKGTWIKEFTQKHQ